MNALLVGWIFGIFIYLKVATKAALPHDASILAALLMAVVAGFLVRFLTLVYEIGLMRMDDDQPTIGQAMKTTLLPLMVALAVYPLACLLIAYGFSSSLSQSLGGLTPFSYASTSGRFMRFSMLVCAPLLIHYGLIMVSSRVRRA